MCGIAGYFDLEKCRPVDESLLIAMRDAVRHRGPDDEGLHIEPGVALGHRRLSIIDVSGGHQPVYNEDSSVVAIYNGEIYNFQEIVDELSALGHTFRSKCDTEVLVHAWEEWGEASVERYNGMFAFALWDRNRKTAFLARDRLGIKPLYYGRTDDGRILFGSELKSLLVDPRLSRELEPEAVEEFFAYGYVPEPRSIFRNVWKLAPGHTVTLTPKGVSEPRRYWDVTFGAGDAGGGDTDDELAEELIWRLRDAVSKRLMSEVPLGAFLSGGVDSSAVVAMMAGETEGAVSTCSIAFGEREFDESVFAQRVAERYRTNHHVESVNPDDFDLLDRLAGLYDEPFADSSAMPTYRVSELARKRVTVALSGDGGDENFAGYRRYRWHAYEERMRAFLPACLRRPLFGLLGHAYPKADWAPKFLRAKSTFEALSRDSVEGYFHSVSILGDGMRSRLFSDGLKKDLDGYGAIEVLRRHAENAPEHPLSRVQYLDLKTYLVGDILTKVDRASMAHSLEVRVPILDHELVEWAATVPPDAKLRGREGKFLFKRALEPYLPQDLLYRPKMGFAVPLASWFRGPLKERVRNAVLGARLLDTGIFDAKFLEKIVSEHQSGVRDFSAPLWSLLMFESFCRQREGETSPSSRESPALVAE